MNRNRLLKESAFAFAVLLALLLLTNIVSRVTAESMPTIKSCNKWGTPQDVFGPAESAYVCGDRYNPNEDLTIYVLPNESPVDSGHSIRSVTAKADGLGHLSPTSLGTFVLGKYDIWVDRDGDGHMSAFEPVDAYSCIVGFLVVPEYWLGPILGLVACFAAFGVFKVSKHRRD